MAQYDFDVVDTVGKDGTRLETYDPERCDAVAIQDADVSLDLASRGLDVRGCFLGRGVRALAGGGERLLGLLGLVFERRQLLSRREARLEGTLAFGLEHALELVALLARCRGFAPQSLRVLVCGAMRIRACGLQGFLQRLGLCASRLDFAA